MNVPSCGRVHTHAADGIAFGCWGCGHYLSILLVGRSEAGRYGLRAMAVQAEILRYAGKTATLRMTRKWGAAPAPAMKILPSLIEPLFYLYFIEEEKYISRKRLKALLKIESLLMV